VVEHCTASGTHDPWQAPLTHAWLVFVQEVCDCHIPDTHVCGTFPEHCVVPAAHDPVHIPIEHVELTQGDGAPHWPAELHDCTALMDPSTGAPASSVAGAHCAVPGAHIPTQLPETHVWFEQATGVPHVPFAPHVSTPLFEHWVAVGVQEPTHPPFTQAWFEQARALPHCPLALHVCTPLPEHCVAPGTQTPVHAPLPHAYWQADGAPQAPVASQVSTPLVAVEPSPIVTHAVAPGLHEPVHAPLTQAWSVHASGVPHMPLLQVW